MSSILNQTSSSRRLLTVLLGLLSSFWLSVEGIKAQALDPLAVCREIADVNAETRIYNIVIDPLEVFHAINAGGETSDYLKDFARVTAAAFYKKTPEELEEARLEVLKWNTSIELIDEFSRNLDWEALAEKISNQRELEPKEMAILVHSFSVHCFNSLRESSAQINRRAIQQLEAKIELNADITESALKFDNEYRARTKPLAQADVDNFVLRRFAEDGTVVFDEIKTYYIEPLLNSVFRNSLAEIDWLESKIREGEWVEESEYTNRRIAFLNVLARVRLLKPKPKTYKWQKADIEEMKKIIASVNGELASESIMTIVSKSKQYQAAQAARLLREGRTQRFAENFVLGRLGLSTLGAFTSYVAYRATRRLVILEKGFVRSTSIYVDQMKANLPEPLRGIQNLDDQLRFALTQSNPTIAGVNLAKDTNIAFREAMDLGQKYYRYVDAVKIRLTKAYGDQVASKVMGWVEADMVTLGTANAVIEQRYLASALQAYNDGGITLRSAEKLARQQLALTPPKGYKSVSAYNKALAAEARSIHSKLLAEAEALLKEQYLEKISGATTRAHFLEWMKFQSRKYWGRFWHMRKFRGMSPNDLSLGQKINPMRWWRDFRKAGEVIPEGAVYRGIVPGESIAGTTQTAGQLGRSLLHKLSWAALIISIGFVAVDIWEAWSGGKLSEGYGDLHAKPQGPNPIDDAANEMILRTHHTKRLIAELTERFTVADPKNPGATEVESVNLKRLMGGTPQIEVVANMESLGGFNPDTGFFGTAYVLLKAYEDSKDGIREDRLQNAMSGILVRFQLKAEGFDTPTASRFGLTRDVPEKVFWVPDFMIDLSELDLESRMNLEEAIVVKEFRANTQKPKLVMDPENIQKIFSGATNLLSTELP